MNVAVLSTISRNAGGLFYSVRWLTQAMESAGCLPTVMSPSDTYSMEDLPLWNPLPVKLYRASGPLQYSQKLRRLLKEGKSELLHVHGIWLDPQWAAWQHQRRTGAPVVVSPRGMLDPWALRNAAWKKVVAGKLFAHRALRQATCIHALCPSERDSVRAFGLQNPVAVIPNGVELPLLDEDMEKRETKTLLFMGRLHPKKGLRELLKAWAAGPRSWKLIVAGWDDGGHEQELRELARTLEIINDITFAGPVFGAEKDALLRRVDGFILPSFSEGLPMSVLEAWSYRLPVIMTKQCNLPEGFQANAALRVESNPESIFLGLEQLEGLGSADLTEMGSNGRRLVEEKFSWPEIAGQMMAVYEWCMGRTEIAPACISE